MKPQDFMKALGGVSQEKLNALAKWQNAKTPITGEIHVQDVSVQEAAEQTVAPVKRRVTMKQSNTKRTPVGRMFPWRIGIGAAAVAAVVVAVSVGKDAIGQRNQMTVGMSGETLITEQVSVQETLPAVNVKQVHPEDSIIWKNNNGDTTIEFTYEIDMSNADTAKYVRYCAEQQADDMEAMPRNFLCDVTTSDGQPLLKSYVPISSAATPLEPAEEPYLLTMRVQPLRGNSSGMGFSEFTLNNIITVSDSKDGEPSQSFTFSNKVSKDGGLRFDYSFILGYGIYDTDDSTKSELKTISYSESECMLYLATQLTGFDTAKGDSYNVFVKMRQGSGDNTTPVRFSLTPDGQKQDSIWLKDLRQGVYEETLTALYPELRTDLEESEITLELWYQPDVIPTEEYYYYYTENDNFDKFDYWRHNTITIKAEYTAQK